NIGAIVLEEGEGPTVVTEKSLEKVVENLLPEARIVFFPDLSGYQASFGNVSDVLEDKQGRLWFAISLKEEDHGLLLRFSPENIQDNQITQADIYAGNGNIKFGEGQKLLEAQDGKIWVINNSYRLGVNIYDGRKWQALSLAEKFGGDEYVTTICQTPNGKIWIGSLGKLYSYDGQNWELFQAPEDKVPSNKMILFPANNGSLWVMGLKSKVIYVDQSEDRWKAYPGLNYQGESEEGKWFLDRYGEVVLEQGKKWLAYGIEDGLIDAPVRILVTSKGQVWAAGSHRDVAATAVLKGDRWVRQTHPQLSWGIDYRAVFEDQSGGLWFGGSVDIDTEKGHLGGVIQLMDPFAENFVWKQHANQINGLKQSNASGIGQSADGRIWVGGGSLYTYDGKVWEQTPKRILREYINTIFSRDGFLLIGSRTYGLFTYDGENWKQYDTDAGLVSNAIISIYADSDSSIWVVTENDISRFDGKKWVNHILPASMSLDFEGGNFLRSNDGICWVNKSPREWKRRALSYSQLPPSGIGRYICYRYQPDKNPPETRFLDYPNEVPSEGNVVLNWQGHDYLNFTKKENLEYSYRIDRGEWSEFSAESRHLFTDLSGGKHLVEVKARDQDFNVDPTPARIKFRVQIPLLRQPVFLGFLLFFLFMLAVFVYIIIVKNQTLSKLNHNLRDANQELQERGHQILKQNQHILDQQEQIIEQKDRLELANLDLANSHSQIEQQRDALKKVVSQVKDLSKTKLDFFTNISHELR
ncbi:MAG: hypothetical protein KDD63_19705, partial [Bacteroidetes bacterium]|nr:hypothetical protein [Bacteroidota bacterium]